MMYNKDYKDSDYGLVLIHPWRGKILVSKVLIRFYYNKDGSISCVSYRKYSDPSKWYSKIGKPNEYIYGKILSPNDKESVERNIQRIRDHLLEYRKDTGKRVDRNTYKTIEYKD